MTAYGSVDSAVAAMRLGAFDYLQKPFHPDEVFLRIDKAFERVTLRREVQNLRRQIRDRVLTPGLVGHSRALHQVLDLVSRVAPSDATVLIQGESGTGKELIAKTIHHHSLRAAGPFVAINCGALPEALLESELFGHVKGAFTGAVGHKKGLFEEAQHGTVFLDEIGDMPLTLQVKLLRVLQEREIRRVGGTAVLPVDLRVLAATNKDLAHLVSRGAFREDLYYRLNVILVTLPPLRERPEDIAPLAEHFLSTYAAKMGKIMAPLPAEVHDLLARYPWPGNVRELANVMERAVVLAQDRLRPADLPLALRQGLPPGIPAAPGHEQTTSDLERAHVLHTLDRLEWNVSRAAKALGIGRTTLWRKLKRYRGERAL